MRVLFLCYPALGLRSGGLQIQIETTAKQLTACGVEVVRYDPWRNQLDQIDVCHVFSLDGSVLAHAQQAREMNKPVVVSPVFNAFEAPLWQLRLKAWGSRHLPGVYSDLRRARSLLRCADRVLPLNGEEQNLLVRVLGAAAERCQVVPNGINRALAEGDPSLIEQRHGVKRYVLEVGSIELRKNQLNLIRAMSGSAHDLVLVGTAKESDQAYHRLCLEAAGPNVKWLGQLPHGDPLLASAYAGAHLFVLPSYSEVMPLCVYEAASAGCRIIVSRNVPVADAIRPYVESVAPDDPRALAAAIERNMKQPADPRLREAALRMPTWADVARQIRAVYEAALAEHDSR